MALYTLKSQQDVARMLNAPKYNPNSQTMYNALGRDAGVQQSNGGNKNFFQKRWDSIENAVGTTGAAIASGLYDKLENTKTEELLKDNKTRMNDIAKKYGYNTYQDVWDARDKAVADGDTATLDLIDKTINPELQAQADTNAQAANEKAAAYDDYRKNNYVSQKINQDQGKFAGSAINTMSTALDVTGLTANPLANAVQGGVEGLADELEQNGFENFDINRAGQNALIGATTGAVTGALNKGISNSLAKRAAAKGLTNVAETGLGNTIKQGAKTIAGGAARGALSGAVGGATGAGLSAALNNQDVLGSALQGAVQGAQQGAVTGGIMAGANAAFGKTNFGKQLQNAKTNWDQSGSNFDERLTNTLTSGDSAVGDWIMNKRQSNVLGAVGNLGNRVQDVSDLQTMLTDIRQRAEKLDANRDDYGMPDESWRSDAYAYEELLNNPQTRRVIDSLELTDNPTAAQAAAITQYLRDNGYLDTPTTAKGWLKKAGQRIVEDVNNKGVGLTVKDTSLDQYKNDPKSRVKLISEIAERAETLKGQPRGKYGTNSWDNDLFEYPDIDEKVLNTLGISGDLDGPRAAAVTQVLREKGIIPDGNSTPTTAKGWLKKAGQRIVEDANNRGVGLGIKDVSGDQYSDDINKMNVNRNDMLGYTDDGSEPITVDEALGGTAQRQRTAQATPQVASAWDRVAQESGYNNYDEVVQRYMEANPNVELNPNNAADQILTWLDQNPNTRPGISGMAQEAPETELYRRLNGGGAQEAEIVAPKTSKETKLKYAQGKELLAQYGTVDQPMARATKAPETFQKLAEMGFTKPEDVERIAGAVTGANGAVSTLNKSIIESAKPVNTFDGELPGQTMDDFIDSSIEHNMLSGTNEGKAVKRGIKAYLKALPSRTEGSITSEDTAASTFKVVQGLESRAAELEGRGGSTYHRATTQDVHQAAVLKDVANLLKDRIYGGADVETAVTPAVVQNLKALDPGNKAWATTVDDFAAKAKTPQDLRAFQKPFVRASRYIDNQYVQAATAGGRMAANAGELPSILPTTKAGIVKQVVNNVWNSNPAHRARAAVYGKLADNAATTAPVDNVTRGQTATTPDATMAARQNTASAIQPASNGSIVDTTSAPTATATQTATTYNPATQIYNAIGRTEGLTNAEQARTANYLADAVQEAEVVPNTNGTNVSSYPDTSATSVYNAMYGTPTATQATAQTTSTGYFQPTGDYWTDIIASALTSAIEDRDVTAFAELYNMYQNAIANLNKSSEKDYSNPMNWSSADRTKLLSAQNGLDQIDQLENAYTQATGDGGSNALQGWLRSRAADISGGNWDPSASNYNNLAESVGMGIIKNLINLGVTEADAERYKKYLPSITDTKEQVESKLSTLRSIYQSQIDNLNSVYGA